MMDGANVRLQGKDISRTEGTDTILKDTVADTPTTDIGATKRARNTLNRKENENKNGSVLQQSEGQRVC